jgi:energy-converting hydrogenase B subunit D
VIAVEVVAMVLVGMLALGTVVTRDPLPQLIVFSLFGAGLSAFFLVVQAPDVALSYIVVSGLYPVMILLTLAKVRSRHERQRGPRS